MFYLIIINNVLKIPQESLLIFTISIFFIISEINWITKVRVIN